VRPSPWLAAVALMTVALPAAGQDVRFSGQVRPRYELRDPVGGSSDSFTSMRVRAAVQALVDPNLSIFIQLQDVRAWGEEGNTLSDFRADNLDVHQAYLRYRGERLDWLTATLGRQETNFGGQRLVGAVGWTQQGRSFDGARVGIARDRATVSLIAYTLADATAPAHDEDAQLFGAYGTVAEVGPGALDVYLLHDRGTGDSPTSQSTFGSRWAFTGNVSGRFEVSLQRGDRAGTPVSAYMVGGRLGTTFAEDRAGLTLWYDYLSGDSDPGDGESGVFSTLYATNHKFYGFADLFLDIPAHTAGAGLQDMAAKVSWTVAEGVRLGADFHHFRAAQQGDLSTAHFANELDLTVSHRYSEHLGVTAGLSLVLQDDALAEIGRLSEDMQWLYIMFDAHF
jgi:hypothetical protein